LKQVDLDGQPSYSEVVAVFFRAEQGPLMMVPNPGSDQVRLLLPRSATGWSVSVIDATGRELLTKTARGDQAVLDTEVLPRGVYSIRAISLNGSAMTSGQWMRE
jgi:hypothetical protein